MGARTEYQAVITCDYCYDNLVEAFCSQKAAIKEARKMGWSVGKRVKCPKCKKDVKNRIVFGRSIAKAQLSKNKKERGL